MKKFINELKRRNVIKASLAYLVIAWVLLQVFQFLLPMLGAPDWLLPTLTLILAIGLPIWIIVSWIYEITPEGIEKTAKESGNELVTQATNKRLNVFIIASLSIAVIVLTLKITNVFASNSDEQYAIAILPFNNIQVDKGNEWLSKSFTQSINSNISKVSKLQVSDSHSTEQYKDSKKSNTEIAQELGVSYILRGTVTQVNNKLNITIELIDVISKKVIMSDIYEKTFEENALNIQQQISQQIVEKLKIELTPQEDKSLKELPTENLEAFSLFSKGRLVNDSREKEDLVRNIEYNKQAIALDSTFAEAYAEIGQSTFLLGFFYTGYNDGVKKAIPYLEKALELDPNTARALAGKGMITSNNGDWEEAQEYFEKAIAANPSDATVHYQYALHLTYKDVNKHFVHLRRAQLLDPWSAQIGHQYFANLINDNKIEEAEQYYNKYRFLFTFKGEQIEKESILIAYKNKDWTAGLRFLEAELEKNSNNAYLNRKLGEAFDGILLDNDNYLKYSKRAYILDSTNLDNGEQYFFALLVSEKFAAAKKLMKNKNFRSLLSKGRELNLLYEYYMAKEDYEKVEEILKDGLMLYSNYNKLIYYANVGNRKAVDSLLMTHSYGFVDKGLTFALLKEKDSMYSYLGKLRSISNTRNPNGIPRTGTGLRLTNSWKEFDPYRKEERYKELLRKNYLPITSKNE